MKENFRPEDAGRMNNKDAQEEANMLRAELGLYPINLGHLPRAEGRLTLENPTAEDYSHAEEEVEKLIEMAKIEPNSEKFLMLVRRFFEHIRHEYATFMVPYSISPQELRETMDNLRLDHKEALASLMSVADQLKELKRRAAEFENYNKE